MDRTESAQFHALRFMRKWAVVAALVLLLGIGLSKKGLQVQMVDDAIELGVRQAAVNVQLGDLLRPEADSRASLPGTTLALRDPTFGDLASQVTPLSRAGVKVYLILLNRATGDSSLDSVLLHPKYDTSAPNRLSAFNVVTTDGVRVMTDVCSAIQKRFGDQITGWIVGNEVNSHWEWANQGSATLDEVADTTERSLRIVHEATNKPVYLSLEHNWTVRSSSPEHSQPGRDVLDAVAAKVRQRGDFEWRLAYHPYPENLFEPRFWLDADAPLSFDAPVISFRNLEVITQYMKRPELRWRGRPRPVNLSEEGFHRPDGPPGEDIQAAAYVYAFERVARNPGIEAFILNRHVDNTGEGGLLLGLWTNQPGTVGSPEHRTRMWYVLRACGTDAQEFESSFALKLIGLKSWREADPKPMRDWPPAVQPR